MEISLSFLNAISHTSHFLSSLVSMLVTLSDNQGSIPAVGTHMPALFQHKTDWLIKAMFGLFVLLKAMDTLT